VQASVHLPPDLASRTHQFEILITPNGKPAETRVEVVHFDKPSLRP